MKLSWNFYSGIVAPVMTIIAIVILVIISDKQTVFSMYYFPFVLLGLIMLSVLIFWVLYLLYIRKKITKSFLIKPGKVIITLGYLFFTVLVLISLLKLASDFVPFDFLHYKTDKIYWLISIWAMIELIHHFFYKLIHDKKQSFIEIINEERYTDLALPIGGAIGIALKKLKSSRQNSNGA